MNIAVDMRSANIRPRHNRQLQERQRFIAVGNVGILLEGLLCILMPNISLLPSLLRKSLSFSPRVRCMFTESPVYDTFHFIYDLSNRFFVCIDDIITRIGIHP